MIIPTNSHLILPVLLLIVLSRAHPLGDGNRGWAAVAEGKRWAVLIAGSKDYDNYRHQADVCHAYQVLKRGGLDDENVVVFMYDDIAFNPSNPRPGTIINKPDGDDVYQGVPKDYTGEAVNANNFFAAILGNKTAVSGSSGKVVDSGPKDSIFIYYADHGGPGVLSMPSGETLSAKDFIDALRRKHEAGTYKNMVIYVEACESGSIFEGLLPKDWNIYVMTASNDKESSWATYCTEDYPSPPPAYDTCLGDMFSVSWIEDSDTHDMGKETLQQQYNVVRRRAVVENPEVSHVEQYGSLDALQKEYLVSFIGTNPANANMTLADGGRAPTPAPKPPTGSIRQRDASLFYLKQKLRRALKGSEEEVEARTKFFDELSRRETVDRDIRNISVALFGEKGGSEVLGSVGRPKGQALVDNWDCFKTLTTSFRAHCDRTSTSGYGLRHTRVLANICNAGSVEVEKVVSVIRQVCSS